MGIEIQSHSLLDQIWNFLSGDKRHSHDLEQTRKVVLLNLIVLTGSIFLGVLGSVAFVQGNIPLCTGDFISVVGLMGLYAYLKTSGNFHLSAHIGTFFIGAFFYFLFAVGGVGQSAFVWVYTYPLVAIFLLGIGYGSFYALALLTCMGLCGYYGGTVEYLTEYPKDLLIRVYPSYFAVYIFCLFMEKAREVVQKKYIETISKLNEIQTALEEKAITDPLTGVYNRAYFDQYTLDSFQRAHRTKETMALIMVDVDNFKAYNDTYGHVAGDDALRTFTGVLKKHLRRETDHIFRYGGEEFAIVLPETNNLYAVEFVNAVINDLKVLALPHERSLFGYLTASFGIYVHPADDHVAENCPDMVRRADSALYEAKAAGRNQYFFYSSKIEGRKKSDVDPEEGSLKEWIMMF